MITITFMFVIGVIRLIMIFLDIHFQRKFFQNHAIKIYLPKSNKWKTKLEPIYEVDIEWYGDFYFIRKWVLQWNKLDGWNVFLAVIIPWPIEIYRYGYGEEGTVCDIAERVILNTDDVVLFYKQEKDKEEAKQKVINTSKSLKQQHLDKLNEVFTQNYE
jgi:hypothetical protein